MAMASSSTAPAKDIPLPDEDDVLRRQWRDESNGRVDGRRRSGGRVLRPFLSCPRPRSVQMG